MDVVNICFSNSLSPVAVLFLGFGFVDLSAFTVTQMFRPGNNSFAMLTLPAGILTPGSKYRFQLAVNDGVKEGVASMLVEVRTGPTSGWLAVDKSSVKAFDIVTITGE